MMKKHVQFMAFVDIENTDVRSIVPSMPRHHKAKRKKQSLPRNVATLPTIALESESTNRKPGDDPIARMPDEMFRRVTSGLIHLDRTKKGEGASLLATFAIRILFVMLIACVLFILAAQVFWLEKTVSPE